MTAEQFNHILDMEAADVATSPTGQSGAAAGDGTLAPAASSTSDVVDLDTPTTTTQPEAPPITSGTSALQAANDNAPAEVEDAAEAAAPVANEAEPGVSDDTLVEETAPALEPAPQPEPAAANDNSPAGALPATGTN